MNTQLSMGARTTIAAMKGAKRWLIWREVSAPGRTKPRKVPYYVTGQPRGETGTGEDAALLATLEEAKAALAKLSTGWGLGFGLGPDGNGGCWQGIDLDGVEERGLTELAAELPGYVETSPSEKGVHAIGYGLQFRSLGSNGSGIEAYSAGRFFTVTGKVIRDADISCLAAHVETVLASRHTKESSKPQAKPNKVALVHLSAQAIVDLRSALLHMRSDDYALWIELGHALKPLGDAGRGLWLDWSATSAKYDAQEAARKWESFDPQRTGHAVVFARAQELGWINPASNVARADHVPAAENLRARPFVAPAAAAIPPRPWQLGHWLLRGTVTTVIAPGGTGKSAFMIAAALSMASGRELLGKPIWGGPKRVWLWNLEDDREELARQLVACCLHHSVRAEEYSDRLFVNDAGSGLCTAAKGRDGFLIHEPVNVALMTEIQAKQIDVLIVDPFVSSHRAEENDNGQVDAIAKRWASIAREANCSVVLVHHSRKLGGQQVDAESARGASALGNAARTVLVLNRMEKSEANRFGIVEKDRRSYIRVGNDKANRAPVEQADWYRLVSLRLANGGPEGGDSVGVVEQWAPPENTPIFEPTVRAKIQAEILSGEWRSHHMSADWAGRAVARVIGADIEVQADKVGVKSLLDEMLAKGELRTETRKDVNRKQKEFVVVGTRVEAVCDSPAW